MRIVIIQGHPDPTGAHLCHALAEAYATGAAEGGHTVRLIDIPRLDLPILRTKEEFEGPPPPAVAEAQEAIAWAEHVVLLFPLWLGTMPAVVKIFLEQVFRPGFAFAAASGGGFPKKLLAGRSARVVVTMGMPAAVFRWWFFEHGLRGLTRNVLRFVGIAPVRETLFGMVETVGADARARWLDEVKALGRRGA